MIEPVGHSAVNINNGHHFVVNDDRYNDLTLAVPVTGDMSGEGVDVGNQLCCLGGCCRSAYTTTKGDGLACYFSLEGA